MGECVRVFCFVFAARVDCRLVGGSGGGEVNSEPRLPKDWASMVGADVAPSRADVTSSE